MRNTDPRLVSLYDLDNPDGPDHAYYRTLADQLGARHIVDLGCGTGILTVTFATENRTVVGIDPDPGMLAYATARPGAQRVRWLLGDAGSIRNTAADLIVMTGNVAQHIVGDAWPRTLTDIHDGLRPGGLTAFESRNPARCAWRTWNKADTYGTRRTTDGPLTEWVDVTSVDADGNVTFDAHNVFEDTGEHLTYTGTLAFRDCDKIVADLTAAGLCVQHVWGGWGRDPFNDHVAVMVFEATRPR